jgi:TonB family protein
MLTYARGCIVMLSLLLALMSTPPAAAAGPRAPTTHETKAHHTIVEPDWIKLPTVEEFEALYPPDAMRRGLEGRAVIRCYVATDGTLYQCVIVNETPAGEGFGDAALKAAASFRMRPQTVDGVPVSGAEVEVPIVFKVDDGEGSPEMLVQTDRCLGFAQAALDLTPTREVIDRFAFWNFLQIGLAAHLHVKPSEIVKHREEARIAAEAALATPEGRTEAARCDALKDNRMRGWGISK